MEKIKTWWVAVGLVIIFFLRFGLSLTQYNADVDNHLAWMESVEGRGWQGLYERDMEPRAAVNYPPITLYSFWLGEKLYDLAPATWQTDNFHAAMYKLPSLIADCLTAWLIWRFTKFSKKMKILMMAIYLLNPALAYNSVWWGQVESLVTFFSLASLLLFVHDHPSHGLIIFAVAMLTKQNALPLIPVIALALLMTKPKLKKLLGAGMVIFSLTYFLYAPLTPLGKNVLNYAASTFISSVGGQPHQWQSTVNTLNFWYTQGGNYNQDSRHFIGGITDRQTGLALTVSGTLLALYFGYKNRQDKYLALFLAATIISLWTFTFATRMHERHGYVGVAYLTFLLPYMKFRWPYYLLSALSFYNLYAVWQEYFYYHSSDANWDLLFKSLSWITVILVLSFPLWLFGRVPQLLHEKRVKA